MRLLFVVLLAACAQKQTSRAKLNHKDPDVRKQGVIELAQAADVDGLLLGLQLKDEETRLRCAVALLATGESADKLVYYDPWFAGTMRSFAEISLMDENPQWRAIAKRALARLEATEPRQPPTGGDAARRSSPRR